jgi:hypothetical protein
MSSVRNEKDIPSTSSSSQILGKLNDKDISWVKSGKGSHYIIQTDPLDINADVESVWRVVKRVAGYERLSHGEIIAHVDGVLKPGKEIKFIIAKDKFVGSMIPQSDEMVTVVDDEKKVVGWERELPGGAHTERYQVLEALSENKTRSYIGLQMPGAIGFFAKTFLGDTIRHAFKALHEGIKEEVEGALVNKF